MSVPRWCRRILDHYGVPYREVSLPSGPVAGARVTQTVFLHAAGHPVAVLLPAGARLDPARVQAVLGVGEVRPATEEEVAGWFKGCESGAVPPLRLRPDQRILMDRSLAHLGDLVFPVGGGGDALCVRFRDWYRAVRPGVGRFTLAEAGGADAEGRPTVLVVEDEPDTNELMCQLLEQEGMACRGVGEGGQALEAATSETPSAILLDLMLPDMSGLEMYQKLRRVGAIRRIPCIVVTALDDEGSRKRSQQLGADVYLTKPFQPHVLVSELRGLLDDARA